MSHRSRRRRRRPEIDQEINLTPLIDVVFVVLIMFIVIAPLLEMDQVALADSDADARRESMTVRDQNPLSIHVKADNSIWLGKRLVDAASLKELLKVERAKSPDGKPMLFHDKRASFGTYQSVKNAVEGAGYSQLDIVLNPA